MRYQLPKIPKPRFKAFLFMDGELHELKSLNYSIGTATRTRMRTENTRKLPLSQTTIQHCVFLLNDALRTQKRKQAQQIASEKD